MCKIVKVDILLLKDVLMEKRGYYMIVFFWLLFFVYLL